MNALIDQLPKMLMGDKLIEELQEIPEYSSDIRCLDSASRLTKLSELYGLYIPSSMTMEIYSKLYLGILQSLQKKTTKLAIQQRYKNYQMLMGNKSNGIIGGSDSFTIIGCSGIGKSSAVMNSIKVATNYQILTNESPYMEVIPCLIVQCPFDCSVKSLLLNILLQVDNVLQTEYHQRAIKTHATTDMLISSVSQVSINHIGLLIIDEIQNVSRNKGGVNLVSMLTQLINSSGISVCMVGTPECTSFFEREMQLARRSLGLKYSALPFDDYFIRFCETIFTYQYVKEFTPITDGIIHWLYEHSSGVISVVVSLVHDAQEIAIMNGFEKLDLSTLNLAYKERMKMLHRYISPSSLPETAIIRKTKEKIIESPSADPSFNLYEIAMRAKEKKLNVVECLKQYVSIEEVAI